MAGDTVLRLGIDSKFTTKVAGSYVDFYNDLSGRMYYQGEVPYNPTYPYAVFQFIGQKPDWTMGDTSPLPMEEFLIQFSIYTDESLSAIEGYVGHLHDLYDWASLTISGYTLMKMQRVSSVPPTELDDVRQAMTTYRLKMDKD